jgi:hypothetical protein
MMSVFIAEFKDASSIIEEYKAPVGALDNANILLAWYGYGSYCGESIVLFERDGKLYENNGSHCSCYGLEGQWEPEETSWDALAMRKFYTQNCDGEDRAIAAFKSLVDEHLEGK